MPAREHQDSVKAPGESSLHPPGGALWDFRLCTLCTGTA